jgi:hypothetical protein
MDAISPNGLTDLLRDCSTSEEMGGVLRREDCLSERGVEDFSGMVQLIDKTWRAHDNTVARRPAGWVGGPSHVDAIAGALVASPYLNDKAHQLYDTDTRP